MRSNVTFSKARACAAATTMLAGAALGGCSTGSGISGPSWNLTGSRNAVTAPAPIAATTPTITYRGGRDPVTGRAPTEGAPTTVAIATPPPAAPQAAPSVTAATPQPVATKAPPSPLPVTAKSGARPPVVEVKHGESLKIAAEYSVSIASLMQANKLRDPYVTPGQWLVLPRR